MTPRAGIVVTGTEVLSGIIEDRNGPWLSERLRSLGVQLAHTMVVGDRREDLRAALDFLAGEGMSLIVTSGGLGPTADDLTAEVVAEFAGVPMLLDEALEGRIEAILEGMRARFRSIDERAWRAGNRKQAMVPRGASVLEPVGTAPGLVVAGEPVVVVLPGPPGELQPMWETALSDAVVQEALSGAGVWEQRIMRLFGPPEASIAGTLRDAAAAGLPLERLEITTCLRRGEIEIATVFSPEAAADYAALKAVVAEQYGSALFARDGETIDDLVVGALLGPPVRTIAVAESCTGGLMAARLTDRGGSSAYALGGVTAYSNAAKVDLAGVDPTLIARVGAVSPEVAVALADGALARFGADVGVGITGIAGPGGGTEEKPVGTVCVCVAAAGGERIERTLQLPGDRAMVRERTTTVAMHMLRRLLDG